MHTHMESPPRLPTSCSAHSLKASLGFAMMVVGVLSIQAWRVRRRRIARSNDAAAEDDMEAGDYEWDTEIGGSREDLLKGMNSNATSKNGTMGSSSGISGPYGTLQKAPTSPFYSYGLGMDQLY